MKIEELDEYGINQKEFYRKALHSKLLCSDRNCDICKSDVNCGFIEVNYPIDTAGNHRIWKCYCRTTYCLNFNHLLFNPLYDERNALLTRLSMRKL